MHIFLQSSQCPICFDVGHHHLQARQHHWPKSTAVRRCLILSSTYRYISRPFNIELSMYSWNVYKFSYKLNVSVRAVLDQLVDINLRDMHGTNSIVKYLLRIYLTVFLQSLYRSSKLTFFKRSPHGYLPWRCVSTSLPITHTTLAHGYANPGRLKFELWRLISVGPQYATCFMLPFWRLEVWSIFLIFWKFLYPSQTSKFHGKDKATPGQALRVPGGWGSQILWQSAHEGCKVFSPTHRPPSPPRKYSWYSFLLEAASTSGP